jgi:hypothetical protein
MTVCSQWYAVQQDAAAGDRRLLTALGCGSPSACRRDYELAGRLLARAVDSERRHPGRRRPRADRLKHWTHSAPGPASTRPRQPACPLAAATGVLIAWPPNHTGDEGLILANCPFRTR